VASHRPRSLRVALAGVLAAALAVVLVPASGQAAPQPTLDQVKARLADLNLAAEVAQEKLNQTQVQVAAAQRNLAQLNARVASSQALVSAAQLQVGELASAAYRAGGMDQTLQLLLADNPSQFLEQLTALDSVARQQGDVLRTAAVAEQRLSQDKLAAGQQLAALRQLYSAASADYAQVQAAQNKATALINSLEAAQRAALAKAQAQAVAEAKAQAAAALAAAQAAAANARAQAAPQLPAAPPRAS